MFALKSELVKFAPALRASASAGVRVLLIAMVLFNAMAPTSAAAMSSNVEQSNLSADSQGIKGSTLNSYAGRSLRAALQKSTPAVTPTPDLSGTPTSETKPTATAVPSQTGTPAPATPVMVTDPAITIPLLSLVADPGFITADSKLVLDWVIDGVIIEEHKSLLLQITLPDGLSLQEGYEGKYDEASRRLTSSITA